MLFNFIKQFFFSAASYAPEVRVNDDPCNTICG